MNLLTGLLIVLAVLIYIYYRYKKKADPFRTPIPERKHSPFDRDDIKFIMFLVDHYTETEQKLALKDTIYLKEVKAKCDELLKQNTY